MAGGQVRSLSYLTFAEFQVFVVKLPSMDDVIKIKGKEVLTYSPFGSLQDPVQYLRGCPVYLSSRTSPRGCTADWRSRREDVPRTDAGAVADERAQSGSKTVILTFTWLVNGEVRVKDGIQMTAVSERLDKIFFQADAERVIAEFDSGSGKMLALPCPPDCSRLECCTGAKKDGTFVGASLQCMFTCIQSCC
jgi:hypothetical protein